MKGQLIRLRNPDFEDDDRGYEVKRLNHNSLVFSSHQMKELNEYSKKKPLDIIVYKTDNSKHQVIPFEELNDCQYNIRIREGWGIFNRQR